MFGSMSNNSPGHSQGKNVKLGIMKNKTKKYVGFFLIHEIKLILKNLSLISEE